MEWRESDLRITGVHGDSGEGGTFSENDTHLCFRLRFAYGMASEGAGVSADRAPGS